MPTETDEDEYRTVQIGAASLVKGILERLRVVQVIDQSLKYQVVMIGDRKLSNRETMLAFCRTEQFFLAAHPWTDTAKAVWLRTWGELQAGKRVWATAAEYVNRNEAHKPVEKRTQYRVCEVEQALWDEQEQKTYRLMQLPLL